MPTALSLLALCAVGALVVVVMAQRDMRRHAPYGGTEVVPYAEWLPDATARYEAREVEVVTVFRLSRLDEIEAIHGRDARRLALIEAGGRLASLCTGIGPVTYVGDGVFAVAEWTGYTQLFDRHLVVRSLAAKIAHDERGLWIGVQYGVAVRAERSSLAEAVETADARSQKAGPYQVGQNSRPEHDHTVILSPVPA